MVSNYARVGSGSLMLYVWVISTVQLQRDRDTKELLPFLGIQSLCSRAILAADPITLILSCIIDDFFSGRGHSRMPRFQVGHCSGLGEQRCVYVQERREPPFTATHHRRAAGLIVTAYRLERLMPVSQSSHSKITMSTEYDLEIKCSDSDWGCILISNLQPHL